MNCLPIQIHSMLILKVHSETLFVSSAAIKMVDVTKFEALYLDDKTADVHFRFKVNAAELPTTADAHKSIDTKPGSGGVVSGGAVNGGDIRLTESEKPGSKKKASNADEATSKPPPFKRVPAHKIMLAAASPVFHAMFFGDLAEPADVEIKDVSSEAFKEFLQFAYLAVPKVTLENVGDVLYLADKYDMAKCTEYCFKYLDTCINAKQVLAVSSAVVFQVYIYALGNTLS